jgi:SAM-dependent methyltransferase
MLREGWDRHATEWIAWARAPGHDSYWRFHRDAFLPLVPSPGRLTVDLGCGEGRLGRDLARLGHRVVGIDGSSTLALAAAGHPGSGGPILVADAAALPLPEGVADCVVAFMSLQDVDAMERAVGEAARVLIEGGRLVMAITHPLNTAGTFASSSEAASAGAPFIIEGSWFERRSLADTCERDGYVMTFHTEHRPLQDYTEALAAAGFLIERLREVTEPDPSDRWYRIPLFLHMRAIRRR